MADYFVKENGYGTLAFLLTAFAVGVVCACVMMLWQMQVPGRLVRLLAKRKAYGVETAVSAAELGYKSEWLLRFILSKNGALRKYVGVVPEEGRLTRASFYLKEQTRDRAELRYRKKNATLGALIAAVILFSGAAVAMNFIIPDLVVMLENFIESLKGGVK